MDLHNTKLLTEYDNLVPFLGILKEFVLSYLNDKICNERKMLLADLDGRIKTRDSLSKKLVLKGQKYKSAADITDLFGARIVTFYSDEIDIIANIIEREFDIDYANSIDKRKIYEVDRFGYMSLHYICRLPKKLYYNEKNPEINDIRFEVQIRTCLQHVWASIFHDIGYKSDIEIPKEYIRRLARLEGLLEVADDEFLSIKNEINTYRKNIRYLISKGEFKEVSLSIDSYKDYLALDPYRRLINKIASINNCEVEEGNYIRYYKVFVDLGIKSLSELEDMRVNDSENAYKLSLALLEGTDIDIISSTIAIQNLLTVYIVKNGGEVEHIKKMLFSLYGIGRVTDSYLDSIIKRTKAILMI